MTGKVGTAVLKVVGQPPKTKRIFKPNEAIRSKQSFGVPSLWRSETKLSFPSIAHVLLDTFLITINAQEHRHSLAFRGWLLIELIDNFQSKTFL